jgi:HAD superfamily hydrolase (TIGR01509 family)
MDSSQTPPRGIIFDLGDVLFKWTAETKTTIPSQKLRSILSTPIWHSYERGEISRENCYQLSAQQFALPVSEIAEAFAQARASLQPDDTIVSFLREAKEDSSIRVYAMSNVGQEDFEQLAANMDWTLFDRVFTSASAGMRKPESGFYQFVLDNIPLAGNHLVFVDDKKENVLAAEALGIRGFVFKDSVVDELRQIFFSPIAKGWRYLLENAKCCDSITKSGITFGDNFAKLLILDALRDK